jgi:hypothetical protein
MRGVAGLPLSKPDHLITDSPLLDVAHVLAINSRTELFTLVLTAASLVITVKPIDGQNNNYTQDIRGY